MLSDKPSQYGACPMVINFKEKTAMPPERARGPAARIYLYMADRYQLRLSKLDRRVYETEPPVPRQRLGAVAQPGQRLCDGVGESVCGGG